MSAPYVPDAAHQRPAGADDDVVEAVGKAGIDVDALAAKLSDRRARFVRSVLERPARVHRVEAQIHAGSLMVGKDSEPCSSE
jgi:hypothetical protein